MSPGPVQTRLLPRSTQGSGTWGCQEVLPASEDKAKVPCSTCEGKGDPVMKSETAQCSLSICGCGCGAWFLTFWYVGGGAAWSGWGTVG